MANGALYTPDDDATLIRIYTEHQGRNGWAIEASKALGRSSSTVSKRKQALEERGLWPSAPSPVDAPSSDDGNVIESAIAARITSLDELLAQSKTDLELWEVERHVVNKWEVGTKNPETGAVLVEPLWQIKAWLKPIKGASVAKFARELLEDVKADTAQRTRIRHKQPPAHDENSYCLEIDLFDLHLGKFAWGKETGHDYDSAIAERMARNAVADLLDQAKRYAITQILLPFGNDFFHTDGHSGATTAGTQVDHDTRFHKMFRAGRALASWMIETCAAVAPVHIPVVPGNHDENAAFTMGVVLEAEFGRDPRVTFDNSPRPRKYYRFGQTLLGYAHGNSEPVGKLPSFMSLEAKDDWAASTCREFHIGHLHTGRKAEPISVNDHVGCTVRWIRSLSGTDAWHAKGGFVGNQRAAEAFVWKFSGGMRAHFVADAIDGAA